MRAYLHKAFELSGSRLVDTELSASYSLTPDTTKLIRSLQAEPDIGSLITRIRKAGVAADAASQAVYKLIAQLGRLGAIRLDTRHATGGRLQRLWLMLTTRRRYAASAPGFLSAMWTAYGLLSLVATAPFVIIQLLALGRDLPSVWPFFLPIPVIIFSFFIHELGHILVAVRLRLPVAILAGVGYFAILHSSSTLRKRQMIALAGPLTAAAAAFALSAIWDEAYPRIMLIMTGAVHALHLLPTSADGRILWNPSRIIRSGQ